MKSMLNRHFCYAAAMLALSQTAEAQTAPSSGWCWLRTHSECRAVVLTELGARDAVLQNNRLIDYGNEDKESAAAGAAVVGELGVLWQMQPRWMMGPAVEVGWGAEGERRVYKVRTRYYLAREFAFDAGVGYLETRVGTGNYPAPRAFGINAEVKFNVRDYLSGGLQYQTTNWPDPTNTFVTARDDVKRAHVVTASVASGSIFGLGTGLLGLVLLNTVLLIGFED
jgi:hypothetical protein